MKIRKLLLSSCLMAGTAGCSVASETRALPGTNSMFHQGDMPSRRNVSLSPTHSKDTQTGGPVSPSASKGKPESEKPVREVSIKCPKGSRLKVEQANEGNLAIFCPRKNGTNANPVMKQIR
jgi:hypothetical protein